MRTPTSHPNSGGAGPTMQPHQDPRWTKKWRIEASRGQMRTTGPERAQAHVQALIAQHGVSVRSIGEVAGTGPAIISDLNRGIRRGMMKETEAKILAVTPAAIFSRPNQTGYVPSIGARRRLQALLVMGWRHQDLSPRLGFRTGTLNHQAGEWISQRKHDAVKELYAQLWNVKGPATALSVRRIAKAGYAPPLAWDDDTIDDPAATPDTGAKIYAQGRAPEGALKHADAVVEDAEFLVDSGCTWHNLPGRLNIAPLALERALHRAGRGDLIHRAKTMTERLRYSHAS